LFTEFSSLVVPCQRVKITCESLIGSVVGSFDVEANDWTSVGGCLAFSFPLSGSHAGFARVESAVLSSAITWLWGWHNKIGIVDFTPLVILTSSLRVSLIDHQCPYFDGVTEPGSGNHFWFDGFVSVENDLQRRNNVSDNPSDVV
jgi:hypothetical protein